MEVSIKSEWMFDLGIQNDTYCQLRTHNGIGMPILTLAFM